MSQTFLYKYTTMEIGTKILRECAVRITQLEALNDPFESHPPIDLRKLLIGHERMAKSLVRKGLAYDAEMRTILEKAYDDLRPQDKQLLSKDLYVAFNRWLVTADDDVGERARIQLLRNFLKHEDRRMDRRLTKNLSTLFGQDYGVLSLSLSAVDVMMWSLYADSNRGIVLGFDGSHPYFRQIIRVRYVKKNPYAKTPKSWNSQKGKRELLTKLPATKGRRWQHEKEYRLIHFVKGANSHGLDQGENPIFLADFPPESLLRIILGSNTRDADMQIIDKAISQHPYSNAEIFKAFLNPSSFSISIRRVPRAVTDVEKRRGDHED